MRFIGLAFAVWRLTEAAGAIFRHTADEGYMVGLDGAGDQPASVARILLR